MNCSFGEEIMSSSYNSLSFVAQEQILKYSLIHWSPDAKCAAPTKEAEKQLKG